MPDAGRFHEKTCFRRSSYPSSVSLMHMGQQRPFSLRPSRICKKTQKIRKNLSQNASLIVYKDSIEFPQRRSPRK